MYEIIPYLYISNYENTKKVPQDFFSVNCTDELPIIKTEKGGTRLNMKTLKVTLSFIKYYIDRNTNVLVYSLAGQQRSAIVVAAYLIQFIHLNINESITFIQNVYPGAFLDGVYYYSMLVHNFPEMT